MAVVLRHPLQAAQKRQRNKRSFGVDLRHSEGRELFERLTLEAFQSGLSWLTILRKREGFRAAFAGFDPERVAGFGPEDRARLMADPGIVRNGRKIDAAIHNAAAVMCGRDTVTGAAACMASYSADYVAGLVFKALGLDHKAAA